MTVSGANNKTRRSLVADLQQAWELAEETGDRAVESLSRANDEFQLVTRGLGVVQYLGGVVEGAVGLAGMMLPPTFAAGAVAFAHGNDVAKAGLKQAMTGESTRTMTATTATSAAEYLGADSRTAELIGSSVDMAVGIGASFSVAGKQIAATIGKSDLPAVVKGPVSSVDWIHAPVVGDDAARETAGKVIPRQTVQAKPQINLTSSAQTQPSKSSTAPRLKSPLEIDFGLAPKSAPKTVVPTKVVEKAADAVARLSGELKKLEIKIASLGPDDFDEVAAATAKPGDRFYVPPKPTSGKLGDALRSYNHHLSPDVDDALKPFNFYYSEGHAPRGFTEHSAHVAKLLDDPKNRWFYLKDGGARKVPEGLKDEHRQLSVSRNRIWDRMDDVAPARGHVESGVPVQPRHAAPTYHQDNYGRNNLWHTLSGTSPAETARADYLRRRGF